MIPILFYPPQTPDVLQMAEQIKNEFSRCEKELKTIFDSLGDKPSEQLISDFIDSCDDVIRNT